MSRLLFGLIRDQADERDLSAPSAEPYMQFAIYDLIGALFAMSDGPSISIHSDELFKRACGIIKGHFADPDFGPSAVAAEAVFHCVICRSYSRCAAQPAAISFIRCGLIMPPVLSSVALRRRLNNHLA